VFRPKYYRNERPSIGAMDVETFKGNLLLVAEARGTFLECRGKKPLELLDFLFDNGRDLTAFFNVKFDASVIVKFILRDKFDDGFRKSKAMKVGSYLLKYMNVKGFMVSKGRHRKAFFDISQFYKTREGKFSLETLSQEFLGEGKLADVDRERLGSEAGYYDDNRAKVIEYCLRDCKLTQRLAVMFLEECHGVLGVWPKFMNSSASLSKAWLERNHSNLMGWFFTLPFEEADFVRRTYSGGMIDVRTLGKVENTTEIDLNSAYPHIISGLFDPNLINRAEIIENGKKTIRYIDMKRISESDGLLAGFYEIRADYNGLMPYRDGTRIIYPLSGIIQSRPASILPLIFHCTNFELGYFRMKGINFEVIKSVEYFGKFEKEFPEIPELYSRRREYASQLSKTGNNVWKIRNWTLKTILNATYGCFAESHHGYTPFTNFLFASLITAGTRVRLWEACDWGEPLYFATDSIIFRGKPDVNSTDDLGGWKVEFSGEPVVIYGVGRYRVKDELRQRGFESVDPAKLEVATGKTLKILKHKPLGLLTGLIQKRFEEVGDFIDEEKTWSLDSNLIKNNYAENLTFERLRAHEVKAQKKIVSENPSSLGLDLEGFETRCKRAEYLG